MIGQLGYLHFNCAMSCHLLRVGKHIDTHRGGSSACPDNDDNDDEDEDGEANKGRFQKPPLWVSIVERC